VVSEDQIDAGAVKTFDPNSDGQVGLCVQTRPFEYKWLACEGPNHSCSGLCLPKLITVATCASPRIARLTSESGAPPSATWAKMEKP